GVSHPFDREASGLSCPLYGGIKFSDKDLTRKRELSESAKRTGKEDRDGSATFASFDGSLSRFRFFRAFASKAGRPNAPGRCLRGNKRANVSGNELPGQREARYVLSRCRAGPAASPCPRR